MRVKIDLEEVEFVTETSLTIRGTRRRTTVPKAIVDRFRLKDGDRIRWVLFADGTMLVTKVKRRAGSGKP